jgi:hypothetical protein
VVQGESPEFKSQYCKKKKKKKKIFRGIINIFFYRETETDEKRKR